MDKSLPSNFVGIVHRIGHETHQTMAKRSSSNLTLMTDIVSTRSREPSSTAVDTALLANVLGVKAGTGVKRHLDDNSCAVPSKRVASSGPEVVDVAGRVSVDWSLKTTAKLTSTRPLTAFKDAAAAKTATVCEALQGFVSTWTDTLTGEERHHAALASWQHPAHCLDSDAISALSGCGGGQQFLTSRRRQWQEAFRSAYFALRHAMCDAFYVTTPDHWRRQFVVLFRSAGLAGCPAVNALFSRSSRGLRKLMSSVDYQLTYEMPLMSAEEQQLNMQSEGVGDVSAGDDGPPSLLLFKGAANVHGLFEFLFNESGKLGGDEGDVPLILAPAPFLGATLSRLKPKLLPEGTSQQYVSGTHMTVHRVELCGVLPPWSVDRLIDRALEAQGKQLKVVLETQAHTTTFNCDVSGCGKDGVDSAAHLCAQPRLAYSRRGYLDQQEQQRWTEPHRMMCGGYVKALDSGGQLTTTVVRATHSAFT